MTDENGQSDGFNRRRVLSLLGSGTAGTMLSGVAGASPGRGPEDSGKKNGPSDGNRGGVGPCTCETDCPEETFCGKVEGAPVAGKTYTFSSDSDTYSVTVESVETKESDEVTGFEFSTDDDIERVCIKGGPDVATYSDDLESEVLRAPTNPGGNRAEISNFSFCGAPGPDLDYFQIDLAGGEVTVPPYYGNLDPNEPSRLLVFFDMDSNGSISDPDDPDVFDDSYSGSTTVPVDGEDCTFSWEAFTFDDDTGKLSVEVTLDSTTDSDNKCKVTLAGYELPEGETEATPENIPDQTLADYETVDLGEGDSTTLDITI